MVRTLRHMTDQTLDAPLLDNTDPALATAPDRSHGGPNRHARRRPRFRRDPGSPDEGWTWKGGGEEEVRYGAYRAGRRLRAAEVEARTAVAATEAGERRAARIVGPALRHGGISTGSSFRSTTRSSTPIQEEGNGRFV